jgi:hypothetical protein
MPSSAILSLALMLSATAALADPAADAAALRARFTELRPSLEHNAFGRPLHLDSTERSAELRGDVHALLPHPFGSVRNGLSTTQNWCDVLTLPFNVKRCEPHGAGGLSVFIVRKPESELSTATRIDFHYQVMAQTDDFLKVQLDAPSGPLGTKNYRIVLEAVPVDGARTFMHMSYGYAYGTLSRLAVQSYLSTSGSNKVGFSSDGRDEHGQPRLVGGMRGILERNTMRYFLAIAAHLDALSRPAGERQLARLNAWFDGVERYPRQLREMERDEYLALKQQDLAGQPRIAATR